ncbi:hypothetical protein BT93_G1467 [Corymbia citriodora subsp. variegata]|nr:hypothetical protein BT93_G1467 [Corymbia citriodora subsp. variegata]
MNEEAKTKKTRMTLWEQPSAVISIPRFDYNTPSSLLRRSPSGFLITCPISRGRRAPPKKPWRLLEKV